MIVLATLLTMTQGLAHNVERLVPKQPGSDAYFRDAGTVAAYDEATSRCLARAFGATACRRLRVP